MIGFKRVASFFAGLIMLAGYSAAVSAADAAADEAAIRALSQTWVKAYNAGDANAIAGVYAEHAVLMPPGAPAVSGSAAIRAYLVKDMAASAKAGAVFSIGAKPDAGASGDLGWESGTYVVKGKSGATVETGKYLSVSKKKDGKWHLIRDTWNSDAPPAPPAATAAPAAAAAPAKPAAPAAPATPAAPPKK